ncbi:MULTISPECIES: MarC family protein [Aquitalea]|uniref:UPF0056 membrane protein n=1 Tax=Aquitalea magnusonii TaxID=332411 RepID=A0A318JPZ5_9NEIS|nr:MULTISPECIES: MarC family protein [Aquitalea]PXX50123.1 multiple antibiotic resistance protein [Aquitalea magnusonii]
MNIFISDFNIVLHAAFVGFVTLFPVVDPLGTAFIVNPYFRQLPVERRRAAIAKVAWYSLLIGLLALALGRWVLVIFGLSIPVVKLAGGIMICKMGWESLSNTKTTDKPAENATAAAAGEHMPANDVENDLFYPISFPLTVGPGTVSVLLTLSVHGYNESTVNYALSVTGLALGMLGMSVLIYLTYLNASNLVARLGPSSENMINRFMSFLVFAVGLQIAWGGLHQLLGPAA